MHMTLKDCARDFWRYHANRNMEAITAQRLRAILKKAGFISAKKCKDRISWHWSIGYRVEYEEDVLYVAHKDYFPYHILNEAQKAQYAQYLNDYQKVLQEQHVICAIVGQRILCKGWQGDNKKMNVSLKGRGEVSCHNSSSVAAPLQTTLF